MSGQKICPNQNKIHIILYIQDFNRDPFAVTV